MVHEVFTETWQQSDKVSQATKRKRAIHRTVLLNFCCPLSMSCLIAGRGPVFSKEKCFNVL